MYNWTSWNVLFLQSNPIFNGVAYLSENGRDQSRQRLRLGLSFHWISWLQTGKKAFRGKENNNTCMCVTALIRV